MRRLLTVLVSALLVLMLLLPAVAGAVPAADAAASEGVVLLATEGEGTDIGVEPPGPNSEENPNPPDDYQPPFLQNIAGTLVFALLGVLVLLGGLYYLLV